MANIFSQAKDLYKMQDEARKMQNRMKQIIVSGNSKSNQVEIRINGINELVGIEIADQLLAVEQKDKLQKEIMQAFKEAMKKLQKEMMKDMDLGKLKSMLGA